MDLSWVNLRKNLSVCSKFWLCGRRLAQGGCEQGESGRRFCQSGQRSSLLLVHSTLGKTSPIYSSLIIIFQIKFSTSLKGSPWKPKNKLLSFPGIACSEIIMSEVPPDEVGRSREPPDPRSSGTCGQGQGHHCLSSLCTISFCETRYNQANLLSGNLFWHVKKKKLKFHNTQSKLLLGMGNLRWNLPTDGFSSSAFPETSSSSQLPPIWAKPGNGDLGGDFTGDEFESKDWTEPVPVWGRLISPNVPACDWQKRRCQGRRRSLRQTRTLQGPPGSKALSQMNCPPAQTGPSQNRFLVNFLNPSIPVIIRSLAQFFSILTFWKVLNRF